MINQAWLVPVLPFAAFVVIILFMRRSKEPAGWLATAAVAASFVISMLIFMEVLGGRELNVDIPWLTLSPELTLSIGMRVDPLAAIMLVVVTSVSLLVHLYSRGYMRHEHHGHWELDPSYARFFALLGLFSSAMLGLVLSNNLLAVYMFWEGVGLGSFLLIGFWYDRGPSEPQLENAVDQRPSPFEAAKKAFVTTRLGDFGLLLGILYIWWRVGNLGFTELEIAAASGAFTSTDVTIAALLVFAGAVGKSAQFPLHVWLPDAMEGPTPVSALIHAATMVAAGVYLMARMLPVTEHSATAMLVVAVIGGFTAIFAATMGVVAYDLKRVMAYSTISQLGYMMLALGAGAYSASIFHLFNHAFFKALLFLTAGSIIHAAGTQDLRLLGGLWKPLRITGITMVIAALSLAGIPPLSGFWSKDEVLLATYDRAIHGEPIFYLLFVFAMITVFLTAFYMFRAVFLTFAGTQRGHEHPHEWVDRYPTMAVPLLILAVPSVLTGLWGSPFFGNGFGNFLEHGHPHHLEPSALVAGLSVALALAGIGMAWAMYYSKSLSPATMTAMFRPIYLGAINKYGLDRLYNALIGSVFIGGGQSISNFDRRVIDGVVNGVARATINAGGALRLAQTGRVQSYALAVFGGFVIIAVFLVVIRVR
ncbi:MAG: NADH-quinone oxidoreductase subunit L [Chloroflexota bacterium]